MSEAPPPHSNSHPEGRAGASILRWRREVPEAIRSLRALANINYADIATARIDESPSRTPEKLIYMASDGEDG